MLAAEGVWNFHIMHYLQRKAETDYIATIIASQQAIDYCKINFLMKTQQYGLQQLIQNWMIMHTLFQD